MNHRTDFRDATLIEAHRLHAALAVVADIQGREASAEPVLDALRDMPAGQLVSYEGTVMRLAIAGRVREALTLFHGIGSTEACLRLVATDPVPTRIETLIWPGHLELDGDFDIGSLIIGGDLYGPPPRSLFQQIGGRCVLPANPTVCDLEVAIADPADVRGTAHA